MNPRVNISMMICLAIGKVRSDKFILNVPDIFKDNNLLLTKSVTSTAAPTTPVQFYTAPPLTLSSPSSFYQVPVLTVTESPPPFPSDDDLSTGFGDQDSVSDTTSNNNDNTGNTGVGTLGTILSRPSAVATDDRLLIVPSAQISLPLITSSSSTSSTSTSNKVTSTALSGSMALFVAFLLSLIPTLAISIPFFAFTRRRRRIPVTLVTGGRSHLGDNQIILLDKIFSMIRSQM